MPGHSSRHIIAACALVSDEAGQILLVKTQRRGWDFPGGQVEEGESLTQATIREIYEESGVYATIGPLRLINSNLTRGLIVFVFEARYREGQLRPQAGETDDVRWVQPDEALRLITHPVCLQRARDLFAAQTGIVYRAYTSDPFQIVETRELDSDSAF